MRVAVIGAGASGLPSIKSCLDEGLDVVCFERRDVSGGLWNYTDDNSQSGDDLATVMKSTVTNLTKESMSYSDFLAPDDFPQYLPHAKVIEYYRMYAEHFRLNERIRFRTEIVRVGRQAIAPDSSYWEVTSKSLVTGVTSTELFDAVMVCVGHDAVKYVPDVEGQRDFTGQILHTHDFKHNDGFRDKRVVIVGCGNSAFDVAVDLSEVCSQVYVSSRRGVWMTSRLGLGGLPLDVALVNRATDYQFRSNPARFVADLKIALNARFDHAFYGLEPDYSPGAQFLSINDGAHGRIASGQIRIRPGVTRMTSRGVEFNDGTSVEDIDVVIFATGYSFSFPFIDDASFAMKQRNDLLLYKLMFAPDVQPPTLAVIGCLDVPGCIGAVAEMQARYATRVFKKIIKLPDAAAMRRLEEQERKKRCQLSVPSGRQLIMIFFIDYMDSLAVEIGCKPQGYFRLLLSDPSLCRAVYSGLATSHQYRLVGPGAWPGARQAVLGIMGRLRHPVVNATAAAVGDDKRKQRQAAASSAATTKLLLSTAAVAIVAGVVLATGFRCNRVL